MATIVGNRVFVVVGAGNWVAKAYASPLKKWRDEDACVTYIAYDPGARDGEHRRATLANVQSFAGWNAICFNVRNPGHRAKLDSFDSVDAVFIVTPDHTHCDEAERWLGRAKAVYVEKPFDVDHDKIRRLKNKPNAQLTAVLGVDHYLIRARRILNDQKKLSEKYDLHLQQKPREFVFNLLEPFAADLVERKESLQEGIIMDLFPHVLALIIPFGDPASATLDSLKPGVFKEANYVLDGEKQTVRGQDLFYLGRESFAEIMFHFTSWHGNRVDAVARVGKCVGDSADKSLVVRGGVNKDREIRLDLSKNTVKLRAGSKMVPVGRLEPKPIEVLIDKAINPSSSEQVPVFNVDQAQGIVERLINFVAPIREYIDLPRGVRLEEYECGASLKDVLAALSSLP